jgi:hypothetical protein
VPCAGHRRIRPRHRGSSRRGREAGSGSCLCCRRASLSGVRSPQPSRWCVWTVYASWMRTPPTWPARMLERQLLATGENEVLVPGACMSSPTTMSMLHSLPAPAPPPPRSRSQMQPAAGSATARSAKSRARATVTERRPCLGRRRSTADSSSVKRCGRLRTSTQWRHAGRAAARAQCDRAPWLAHAVHNFDQCGKVAIETCALNESRPRAGRNCVRREQVGLYMSTLSVRRVKRFNKLLANEAAQ